MMAFSRMGLVVLMVSFMVAVARSTATDYPVDMGAMLVDGHGSLVADSLDVLEDEMMMESESARRQLGGRNNHVGYGALKPGQVPCNKRGSSYYNCRDHQQANPYKHPCNRATRCGRNNR